MFLKKTEPNAEYITWKQNCVISNRFDVVIWQIWLKQDMIKTKTSPLYGHYAKLQICVLSCVFSISYLVTYVNHAFSLYLKFIPDTQKIFRKCNVFFPGAWCKWIPLHILCPVFWENQKKLLQTLTDRSDYYHWRIIWYEYLPILCIFCINLFVCAVFDSVDNSLMSNIQKLFSEKIEIFSAVEFSKVSVLTGIIKISLKVSVVVILLWLWLLLPFVCWYYRGALGQIAVIYSEVNV